MTAITDNRKRSREDDNCDFMPLSKRINNLHIDAQVSLNHQDSLRESFTEPGGVASYNPGISSEQSSYYFDNKLLYELFVERLQRNGQQSPY